MVHLSFGVPQSRISPISVYEKLERAHQVLHWHYNRARILEAGSKKGQRGIACVLAWEAVDEIINRMNELELQALTYEDDRTDYDLELSQRIYDC